MLRHLARTALAACTHSAPTMHAPVISETNRRTHAALALAAAWRRAASGTSGSGAGGEKAGDASTSTAGGAAQATPTTPHRVAEMAALFTCNVCGEFFCRERERRRRGGEKTDSAPVPA